jgi:hypothetical protein
MTRLEELVDVLDERPLDPERDGFDSSRGLEFCPLCGKRFSGNGLYWGPVYDQRGRFYQSPGWADPADGPFFCRACWPHVAEACRRRSSRERNHTLDEYAEARR